MAVVSVAPVIWWSLATTSRQVRDDQVRMPGLLGSMLWSCAIPVPPFAVVSVVCF